MRAIIQRVTHAHVTSEGSEVGRIGPGLVVLVGVTHNDDAATATRIADKIHTLRIFDDEDGQMNLSAADLGRDILVVSQFTLYADTRKGRRPSYVAAARPDHAEPLVEAVVDRLRINGAPVATGRFRTDMAVHLVNDGPITITVEV